MTSVTPSPSATAALQAPASRAGVALDIRAVTQRYGARTVLNQASIRIQAGEFVAIVGRSGCGKSTLLRLVAGLERPTGGQIQIDGTKNSGLRQGTRIMFQDARLLPWKRVGDNVALGLQVESQAAALAVLDQVGLADRANDWPAKLSGGQRQRVALARALVHKPDLLLLDEPLGALDALTRVEMHSLIEGLWQRNGFTALLVTHDVQEAVALADRVILIEDGVIALDERVNLPRPRSRGNAAFAALEARILGRVLQRTSREEPANEPRWVGDPAHGLRWAI